MADQPPFQFLQMPKQEKWVILSPRRAKRPNAARGMEPICPFCSLSDQRVLLSLPADADADKWLIKVIPNKFPFALIHEVILHSPDHHKNINELPKEHVLMLLDVFQQRFALHQQAGNVCIFHNRGMLGGESIPHPHSQLAVMPFSMPLDMPVLGPIPSQACETTQFIVFSPAVCQWPDEIWIVPKQSQRYFPEITDAEKDELSALLPEVIQLLDLRHGNEFPFNFTIHPQKGWFLRIVPRQKILGGFEIGTGVYVNTQDPIETNLFLQEHLGHPNHEKILREQQAAYHRSV